MINLKEFKDRRAKLYNLMEDNSVLILYAGMSRKWSADDNYPFMYLHYEDGVFFYGDNVVKEMDQDIKDMLNVSKEVNYKKYYHDNTNLYLLLKKLDEIDGLEFIRVLYTYPEGISDDLLHLIASSRHITHYFDIPLQHCTTRILKSMNRHDTKESILNLYQRIKSIVPDAILRTTLIAGFPGENDNDAKELLDFIKEVKFNHLGVFTFSKEEGTKAALLKDQVDDKVKQERKDALMNEQKRISYELNKALIGKEFKAIVTKLLNNHAVGSPYSAQ